MGYLLYGDSGSERLIFAETPVNVREISEFYSASSGIMAGYQWLASGQPFWYYVQKYNSRNGGYLSGYLDDARELTPSALPCIRMQEIRFHTIEEFEEEERQGSETIGDSTESLTREQAIAFLQLLFKALCDSGQGQIIYMTISSWNGSEAGFVQEALGMCRMLLQVLPVQLQRYISFSVNTAPNFQRAGIHHTQLQFLMPAQYEKMTGQRFDCSARMTVSLNCHKYVVRMARSAVERQPDTALSRFEDCIMLPASAFHAYPMREYLALYDFLMQLRSFDPNCSDAQYNAFCDVMERSWISLRKKPGIRRDVLLRKITAWYPPDIADELMEIERTAAMSEMQNSQNQQLVLLEKQRQRELIEALRSQEQTLNDRLLALDQDRRNAADRNTAAMQKRDTVCGELEALLDQIKTLKTQLEQFQRRPGTRRSSSRRAPAPDPQAEAMQALGITEINATPLDNSRRAYDSFKELCIALMEGKASGYCDLFPGSGTLNNLNFPPRSIQPGNRQIKMYEPKSLFDIGKVFSSFSSRMTPEEYASLGIAMFCRLCVSEYLKKAADAKNWCFEYPINSAMRPIVVSTYDLVYPMTFCLCLFYGDDVPPAVKGAYEGEKASEMLRDKPPVLAPLTMYFVLVLCAYTLGMFIPNMPCANSRAQKKIITDNHLIIYIRETARLFSNPTAARNSYENICVALGIKPSLLWERD